MSIILILLKVHLLVSVITSTKATTGKGNLPNLRVISSIIDKLLQPDLIDQYIKPIIRSLELPATNHEITDPVFRVTDDISIQKAVKAKLAELKPFLQDNEADNLDRDQDENDTTIIEFIPKAKHKDKFGLKIRTKKLKKLRDKIKRALQKEKISPKTKNLIIKTLDDMLASIVNNACDYKGKHPKKIIEYGKNIDSTLKKINISLPALDHYKQNIANFSKDLEEALVMFNTFSNYSNTLVKQLETEKFVTTCTINPKNVTNTSLRQNEGMTPCNGFKLCSEELERFLIDFYNSLNDTTVSVFRNYAAMYERDVTTANVNEKEAVISEINKAGDKTERKLKKIFIRELMHLNFDKEKDGNTNQKILKEFINNNVQHIKSHFNNHLKNELKCMKAKLLLVVKKDLDANIETDLTNLNSEFVGKICRVFGACNGVYLARRNYGYLGRTHFKDANSVYVKLRLNLDKQLKDTVLRANRELLGINKQREDPQRKQGESINIMHLSKYTAVKLNVTRTTGMDKFTEIVTAKY